MDNLKYANKIVSVCESLERGQGAVFDNFKKYCIKAVKNENYDKGTDEFNQINLFVYEKDAENNLVLCGEEYGLSTQKLENLLKDIANDSHEFVLLGEEEEYEIV